jgi:DNA replication initiation complex subunit (GINS family)
MKKIETILHEKNVQLTDLPSKIQKAIKNSNEHYAEWEKANSELNENSSDEEKDEVESLLVAIENFNESIEDAIDGYLEEKDNLEKEAKDKAEKEAQAKKDAEEKAKKDAETQQTPPAPIEKKSSKGWLIFGALALVVTLGAVNVMNKD